MFRTPRRLFRTFAFAEMVSWALLIGGMVLRATADLDVAVTIGGAIHGLVFLCYAATALVVALNQRWPVLTSALAVGSAVVPFATLPTERVLDRRGRLEGAWRLTESGHPRDRRWHDRALRWALRHPVPLAGGSRSPSWRSTSSCSWSALPVVRGTRRSPCSERRRSSGADE
ncbi:DUF3817 domain-containing protein [Litorihabitans aurantiacus]|uniref:DUF3817 domain-containing protein n=1 Tax=Litorihabitans aurantiacus TaxID=1930061 RepID=A0AA37XBI3_9MICO|nr:hypothetical protein GCM10025875_10710 [Litorihabitans aurantiacus]